MKIDDYFKKYCEWYYFEEGNPEKLLDKEDFKIAVEHILRDIKDGKFEES